MTGSDAKAGRREVGAPSLPPASSFSPRLAKLFPNRTLLDVLGLIVLHPEQDFYQHEIAERTRSSILQVQRALKRMEEAGLVQKTRRGNRVYYSAERSYPGFGDLKTFLLKTIGLGHALRTALDPLREEIVVAAIFGSLAAGTERSSSDVDLLLVGQVSLRRVAEVLGPVARGSGREINPVVYESKEFRARTKADNHFIRRFLDGPKIWLVGGEDELAKLVG